MQSKDETRRTSRDPLIFYGIDILKTEEGSAEVEIALEVTEDMMNPNGTLHGGMSYTLADICAGMGAYYLGYKVATTQGNINYIRPHKKGMLTAKSILVHQGRTSIVCRVDTTNKKGKLITTGTFTMAVIGKRNKE